jgi:hypothetical protein
MRRDASDRKTKVLAHPIFVTGGIFVSTEIAHKLDILVVIAHAPELAFLIADRSSVRRPSTSNKVMHSP